MVQAQLLDAAKTALAPRHQQGALALARRLPGLIAAAKDVAASVMHGVHGRRRAGIGETFWQFRPFSAGEPASRIDWRRSARDDRLYVREREWETAHNVWLWIDRSASMRFVSDLAMQSKIDRALVLGLACADLLVRGGERVALFGLTRPRAARDIVERLAQALLAEELGSLPASELPGSAALAPREQAVLIGDFLSPAQDVAAAIEAIAARGARGHVLMIADPVEESFPFAGHMEFIDPDSGARLRAGQAEDFRALYVTRLAAHRDAIKTAATRRGWSFAIHRTDRPASGALLALSLRLQAGEAG